MRSGRRSPLDGEIGDPPFERPDGPPFGVDRHVGLEWRDRLARSVKLLVDLRKAREDFRLDGFQIGQDSNESDKVDDRRRVVVAALFRERVHVICSLCVGLALNDVAARASSGVEAPSERKSSLAR